MTLLLRSYFQGRIKPSGPHAKFLGGPFSPSHFLIPFLNPFSEVFQQLQKLIIPFSVMNLKSPTYSKKLIVAMLLYSFTYNRQLFAIAKVSTMSLILSSKERKGWRKMNQGVAVFR